MALVDGEKSRSPQALELRDYILHWRYFQMGFRTKYSAEYLQTLSINDLRSFVYAYLKETPFWAYEGPVCDGIHLLFCHSQKKNNCSLNVCSLQKSIRK